MKSSDVRTFLDDNGMNETRRAMGGISRTAVYNSINADNKEVRILEVNGYYELVETTVRSRVKINR